MQKKCLELIWNIFLEMKLAFNSCEESEINKKIETWGKKNRVLNLKLFSMCILKPMQLTIYKSIPNEEIDIRHHRQNEIIIIHHWNFNHNNE